MKFFHNLAATLAAFVAVAPAMAQFNIDQGAADTDTQVSIKQTGPGAAELTFTGAKLVYLNRDPKVDGIKSQADMSKKGKVWIVDVKAATPDVSGGEFVLSGVGRGGWAVLNGKTSTDKVKSTPLADTYSLPITIDSKGRTGCLGFTVLVAKDGKVVPSVYGSKPGFLMTRGNGETDHVMVACVDETQKITLATPTQAKAYAPVYKEVTTATVVAGSKK